MRELEEEKAMLVGGAAAHNESCQKIREQQNSVSRQGAFAGCKKTNVTILWNIKFSISVQPNSLRQFLETVPH